MHEGSPKWPQSCSEFSTLFYEIKARVIHHPLTSETVFIQFASVITLSLL